ncbi:MAG: hypothetical protein HEP71_08425 [Roseivirga sp.]|nr:hypothetical protein [Roseivirga sp.]
MKQLKRYFLISAVLLLAYTQLVSQSVNRGTISGTVLDAKTKKPVSGCYVYLSGYTKGITTNSTGTFTLTNIPGGVYELVLSHVSYKKHVEVIELNQKPVNLEVRLGESTTTLETVYVTNVKDLSQRRRNLKKFKEFFFGEDYRVSHISIENEQDIELTKTSAGIIQSTHDYTLNIDNDYLGYKISYYLKDLLMSKPTNMVLGFPKFSPKPTNNPAEDLYWTENRQRVFNGSIRHFFKSLIAQELEEEGFQAYLTRKDPEEESEDFYKDGDERKLELDDKNLPMNFTVEATENPNIKRINFGEIIDVNYGREFVKNGGFQNSKIKLLEDYVYVFNNGVLVNPSSIKLFGQWSKEGMYQMLPFDYVSNDTLVLEDNLAQVSLLNDVRRLTEEQPVEKVYIHSQSNDFFPGETIWYKAYLMAGPNHQPSPLSQNIHIELLDGDRVINSHILRSENGMAAGSMELPELMKPGKYILRAYTTWMRNSAQEYFFRKVIQVHHEETELIAEPSANAKTSLNPDLQFFPEGGQLIAGVSQKVAFKAIGKNGLPVNVSGVFEDSNGNISINFESSHDGMGFFEFVPTTNTTYTVQLDDHEVKTILPFQATAGLAFSVDNRIDEENAILKIRSSDGQSAASLFLIAQSKGWVNYTLQFELENGEKTLVVPKSLLADGIVQLTIFTQEGQPVAERLIFNQKEDVLNIDISTSQTVASARGKTELVVKVTDKDGNPVSGSFSMAALHDLNVPEQSTPQHIDSYLLLSSDLKGYIHNPGYYFDHNNPYRQQHLDLVMLTNGWTRFRWEKLQEALEAVPPYGFEQGIDVSGRLLIQGRQKGVKNGSVTSINNKGEEATAIVAITDKKGYFHLEGVNPQDNAKVMLKGLSPKGNKKVSFEIDSADLSAPVNFDLISRSVDIHDPGYTLAAAGLNKYLSNSRLKEANEALNTLEAADTSGLSPVRESLYGTPSYSVKFEELTKGSKRGNVFQYLNGRVPGLRMTPNGPLIRGTTASPFGDQQDSTGTSTSGTLPLIYLDNSLVEMSTMLSVPVEVMERLEVMKGPEALVLGMGAQSGALLFFTKIGSELPSIVPNGIFSFDIQGYHIARDFYVPAYDQPLNFSPDHRKTIFWEPHIITDENGLATISYFNTDYPGEVIVSIEGLSFNGKPGHASHRYAVNIKE